MGPGKGYLQAISAHVKRWVGTSPGPLEGPLPPTDSTHPPTHPRTQGARDVPNCATELVGNSSAPIGHPVSNELLQSPGVNRQQSATGRRRLAVKQRRWAQTSLEAETKCCPSRKSLRNTALRGLQYGTALVSAERPLMPGERNKDNTRVCVGGGGGARRGAGREGS